MIAVIYNPETGIISNTLQAADEATIAQNGAYIIVSEFRNDYDINYTVKNGKLVPNGK